ncbi:MAG TPA: rhodanese-like domain-containing protein [Pyrinomonadaceae bacterium]|nr:rhodanese-like domain-containing protein [Pyrinomonadaceae bacterium]
MRQVSVEDAKSAVEVDGTQFIDVRTPAEFDAEHAAKSINYPLDTIEADAAKLNKSKPVYIICQTGRRSQIAAAKLNELGFSDVADVQGGMNAWTKAGLPTEKK